VCISVCIVVEKINVSRLQWCPSSLLANNGRFIEAFSRRTDELGHRRLAMAYFYYIFTHFRCFFSSSENLKNNVSVNSYSLHFSVKINFISRETQRDAHTIKNGNNEPNCLKAQQRCLEQSSAPASRQAMNQPRGEVKYCNNYGSSYFRTDSFLPHSTVLSHKPPPPLSPPPALPSRTHPTPRTLAPPSPTSSKSGMAPSPPWRALPPELARSMARTHRRGQAHLRPCTESCRLATSPHLRRPAHMTPSAAARRPRPSSSTLPLIPSTNFTCVALYFWCF
jgi:hypothetical protein